MPDLLNEMLEMAVSSDQPLADLIRRCMVLAVRFEMDDFKQWAIQELNGYPSGDELPAYRVCRVQSYGTFSNGFRTMKNCPIPTLSLPDWIREKIEAVEISDSIGAIEQTLIPKSEESSLRMPWIPDMLPVVGAALTENDPGGYQLLEAWQLLPITVPTGIVETVRNRVLSFVLEVQKLDVNVDNPKPEQVAAVKEPIRDIYNITIQGDNKGNISGAQTKNSMNIVNIEQGDVASLMEQLEDLGIKGEALDKLEAAIEEDKADPSSEPGKLGSRVTGWVGDLATNVASGVATNLSMDTVNTAVKYISECLLP